MGFRPIDSGGGGGGGGSGTVTNTGTLTASQLVIGNGGVDIKVLGTLGTTTTLLHGNAAGDPTFAAVSLSADVSGTLPPANGGIGIASYTIGDLLYASGATTLSKLVDVAAGSYLRSGGVATAPVWSTLTLPNTATTGDIQYASASNVMSNLADVAVGSYLRSGGVATAPLWSTTTLPNAATTGDLLYASASNVYSNLAAVATGQVLISAGATTAPVWSSAVTLTQGTITTSIPQIDGSVTVNQGATSFTVWKLNVTNTASSNLNLLSIQLASVNTFVVNALGIFFGNSTSEYLHSTNSLAIGTIDFTGGTTGMVKAARFLCYGGNIQMSSGATAAGDLFINRIGAATLQFGDADVNGNAVAQTTRVQSGVTGTDKNGGNWTFIGSKQTGAGTPGDIIFQTSVKLASGATQGTPVTGLTITGAAASMQPSVVVGNQALATTATEGFLYIPTCAGTPAGTPTARTGRVPLIYDTTGKVFWIYDGAWLQPKTPAAAAVITWQ